MTEFWRARAPELVDAHQRGSDDPDVQAAEFRAFRRCQRRLDYLFASDLLAGQALQAAFRMETAFNREREKGPRNG